MFGFGRSVIEINNLLDLISESYLILAKGLAKLDIIVARHIFYVFVGYVAHTSEDVAKLVDFVVEANAIDVVVVALALSSKIRNGA